MINNKFIQIKYYEIFLIVFGIFLDRYFELATLLFVNFSIIFRKSNFFISKKLLLFLLYVSIISFFSNFFIHQNYNKLIQQLILVSIFSICYGIFFLEHKCNINIIFDFYLKFSIFISFLGILQFIIFYFFNFDIFDFMYEKTVSKIRNNLIRINSIMREPSNLSTIITPAFTYYFFKKKSIRDTISLLLLLVTILFTFSAITYLVIALLVIYKIYTNRNIYIKFFFTIFFVFALLVFINVMYVYNNFTIGVNPITDILIKLSQTFMSFFCITPEVFESLNLSTYAILSNLYVALESPFRLFGTGIGSHELNYNLVYISDFKYYGLNSTDAYSCFIRIFSEFGIIGIIILIVFFIRHYNRKSLINLSALSILFTLIIRGGHYVLYGTVFFVYLYFYSSKRNLK